MAINLAFCGAMVLDEPRAPADGAVQDKGVAAPDKPRDPTRAGSSGTTKRADT